MLEVCIGNPMEALKAASLGADRLELCDNLMEGGTTPSYGYISYLKEKLTIPLNVIIRPRGGNFVYTSEEIEIMKRDIELFKELGVHGLVLGVLKNDSTINTDLLKELIEVSKPLSITYHMAFDEIEDKKAAIDILVSLGVDRILTKGGEISAPNNIETLKDLINYAKDKIIVMPGGGITKANVEYIKKATGALELHGTKIVGDLK